MYCAATTAKSQSWGVSMSIDSNCGPSYIMGFLPMRALVAAKLSPVKMYRFEFSSNQGSKSWVRTRLSGRSEEHTSELQSLMRISYAVFCLKKKKTKKITTH